MVKMFIICSFGFLSSFAAIAENGFEIAVAYDPLGKTVNVEWKNKESCAYQFILQKSNDELNWVNVDTLYNTEDFNEQMILWEDRNPVPGGFLYRIKNVIDDFNFSFSRPVFVNIIPTDYDWIFTSYNKMDKIELQYTGQAIIEGVINVFLQTRSGKILFKSRYSSFTTNINIPVANLGKGSYYISMFVGGELIWKHRLIK